jgi:hypothetical protein
MAAAHTAQAKPDRRHRDIVGERAHLNHVWRLDPRAEHQASSVRTPLARMLPSVIGGPL